jgi:hypothetical protein
VPGRNQSSGCQRNKMLTPLLSQQRSDDGSWNVVHKHGHESGYNGNYNQEAAEGGTSTSEEWSECLVFTPLIQMSQNFLQNHHQQHQQLSISQFLACSVFTGIGLSIFSLVGQHFFCHSEFIIC